MSELTLPNIKTRPVRIIRATGLLAAIQLINFISMVVRYIYRPVLPRAFGFVVSLFVLIYAAVFFMYWKIYEGRNWARVTFVVIGALAILTSPIYWRSELRQSIFVWCRLVEIAQVYAAFMICTSPGKEWFSKPRS